MHEVASLEIVYGGVCPGKRENGGNRKDDDGVLFPAT